MISPEEQNSKPYALTVQCIAYESIKDSEIRAICNKLIKEMRARKMKVAGQLLNVTTHLYGTPLFKDTPSNQQEPLHHCLNPRMLCYLFTGFSSNGEWNSLCSKGNTRPLTIFEVRSRARSVFSHCSVKMMVGMLTPKCM